jgi:DNA modification methylase
MAFGRTLRNREFFMDLDRLYQRDCVEGLSQLEPESVDLVFADPPFNIGYDYDVYEDRRGREQYLHWTGTWGRAVQRILKPTGAFWLAIGDEYAAELKLVFQNALGLRCRSWVIWYYTFGVNCTKKFSRSHAHLFHFVKDFKKFTFNSLDIRVPSARQLVYKDSRGDPDGRLPDDTWILRPQDLPEGFQADEDTWYFRRVCGTFKERAGWHGCQMPEQLLGRIIRASSNPGDVVLDPFAGSGTTLVAAKKLGRRWLGFELSANYVARAQARLDAAVVGQLLEGADEPKVSAPRTPKSNMLPRRNSLLTSKLELKDTPDVKRGIIAAYMASCKGFSSDRVIADPELNDRFLQWCDHLGLAGKPYDWNWRLMNIRKAGQLKGLPKSKKTKLTREEIDDFCFACEIGLRAWKERNLTLDRILCDPEEGRMFEQYVQSMISKRVEAFKIRWVAFHFRKRAKKIRLAGCKLTAREPLPKNRVPVYSLALGDLPQEPGLYWLQGPDKNLYVGETLNLRKRFKLQFESPKFDFWNTEPHDLQFRFRPLMAELEGNQSKWIAAWDPPPLGNYLGFAAL